MAKRLKNMKGKFIIIILAVILILILGAVGLWHYQKNIYSKETLKLEIFAPEETELAKEVDYLVKYKNNGNIRLENPNLIFEYPRHSIPIEDQSTGILPSGPEPLRQQKPLDDIYPGEERSFHFKARLLGGENEALVAKAWLSYQPKNIQARYESATTFTTIIKNVPLTFEFDLPTRIEPAKDTQVRLNYFSNVNYPLSDLRIQLEYPEGFEFLESTPKGLEKDEWEIPLLNRSDGGRIIVSGKLSGEVGSQRNFKARIGIWRDGEFILLKETMKAVVIVEPLLYLSQQINGNPEYTASPAEQLHFEISFKNIGNTSLSDLFLIVRLEGGMIDFQTLKSDQGKFEPGDNSIVFDKRRVPKLQVLNPQEEGKVEFWLELKEGLEQNDSRLRNPLIRNKVFLGQAQKEFVTKVNSKLGLTQQGYFQDEVFGNSGPLPPKVGEVTTYTIMWQVKNFYNEVKNARVKAILPLEVRLTGKIFPEDQTAKFAFDFQSREIVWELGDLEAGKGAAAPSAQIAFQLAFAPTISQIGQLATLINEAEVTGEDSWTGQMTKKTSPLINTALPNDPSMRPEMGRVE